MGAKTNINKYKERSKTGTKMATNDGIHILGVYNVYKPGEVNNEV